MLACLHVLSTAILCGWSDEVVGLYLVRRRAGLLLLLLCFALPAMAGPIRIKDLVEFDGVRGNDLVGYGLVVGLNGTGDGIRNAPFTEEIMSNLLERLGVNVAGEQYRPKNVAAVFVTAALPPFARAGGKIDVTVSAIGDAKRRHSSGKKHRVSPGILSCRCEYNITSNSLILSMRCPCF